MCSLAFGTGLTLTLTLTLTPGLGVCFLAFGMGLATMAGLVLLHRYVTNHHQRQQALDDPTLAPTLAPTTSSLDW